MYKRNAADGLDAEIMAYGFTKSRNEHGQPRWGLKCAGCDKTAEVFRPDLNSVEQLITHFTKKDWVLAENTPPYHSTPCYRAAKAAKKPEKAAMTKPEQSSVAVMSIGPDPKVIRQVITLLNEQFDADKKQYKPGWSDERVAKEAPALLDFVIKYRRDAYGELAEHPEIVKLREAIKELHDEFALSATEVSLRLADLTTKLESLAATFKGST